MGKTTRAIVAVALLGAAGANAANLQGKATQEAVQGLGTVAQGAMQVGQAAITGAKEKADKFVDTAGNVYTVLRDATGAATNFVMDTAGVIFDVTKMTGSFIIDAALGYPQELIDSMKEGRQDLQAALAKGMDGAQALGQFAMQARPELPPLNQMHKPSAWMNAAGESYKNFGNAFNQLEFGLEQSVSEFEDKYCTPATFTPSEKKPAEITMPGFRLEIGLGDCVVDDSDHKEKQLLCRKPFITYGHIPGGFVSKRHTAPSFTTKECKIEKTHGDAEELVLFEFSGHTPNLKDMAETISQQVGNAVGSLASGATNLAGDVTNFIGNMKNEKQSLQELVKAYDGLPQPNI
ncbi:hypothetical protein M9435_000938 [Picochlorum sp. BPE23]|nr:hypothetical protein M9435_000938 [Picochlorum sp. BPE23]